MHASNRRIFVAGASGAIGRVLCRLLLHDGWSVVGTTRSLERASELRARGVDARVVDVFNRDALRDLVTSVKPSVVVHQLTDLPKEFNPSALAAARPRNARLREAGTANLVAAAVAAGATRMVAQSIAFAYAPGARPLDESAPLDAESYSSVVALESAVLRAPFNGLVLRYGRLYGPATWYSSPDGDAPLHVDAAAHAARCALTQGASGIYNVAEDDGAVSSEKAKRELGWSAAFRVT